MWIKICGITSADAVSAAAAANVDAIGFVFAPSPRQVTPGQAAQLAALAPPGILRIAVAQHPLQMKVDEICRILKPDYFQTDVEDLRELKIPPHIKVLPVVRFGRKTPNPLPARIVFEGPSSGIGELADWGRAAELARQTEVILAGGLSAQNVAEAVQAVRPFGVDVSSGVEEVPGVKDPDKIHRVRTRCTRCGPALGAGYVSPSSGGAARTRHLPRCQRPLRRIRRPLCARDIGAGTRPPAGRRRPLPA